MEGTKQRKKKGMLRTALCSFVFVCTLLLGGSEAYAYTNLDIPGVVIAPDGGAWTIDDPVPVDTDPDIKKASYHETLWKKYDTGIALDIKQPGVGQHAYTYERKGLTPIYKWVCTQSQAGCIHGDEPSEFHGMNVSETSCYTEYWSGFVPYCADCGDWFGMLHYIKPDKIAQIQYIDTSIDYYYRCPHGNDDVLRAWVKKCLTYALFFLEINGKSVILYVF